MENDGWWKLPNLSARAIGPFLGEKMFLPKYGKAGFRWDSVSVPLELRIGDRPLRAEIDVPVDIARAVGLGASVEDLFNYYTSRPEVMLKILIVGDHVEKPTDCQTSSSDAGPDS